MSFQKVVNAQQAPAVVGDFASTNPFASVLAGAGALVAPAGGLIVGNFAWVGPQGQVSQSFVAGYQIGFLGRNQQALITEFLGEETLVVPEGFMVTLFNEGDFWANFPAGVPAIGNNVYADPNDGTPLAGASAPTLGTATAQAGFDGTCNLVLNSTTLTVATVVNGIISVGDVVTDSSNAYIPSGTVILAQLTGTAGGVGTYQMSQAATHAATGDTLVGNSDFMLVTAIADGSLNAGDVFSGTDVAAGSTIVEQATPFSGVASIITGSLSHLVVTSVQPGSDLLRAGATLAAAPGLGITTQTISSQVSGTPGGVGTYALSAPGTAGAGVAVTTTDSAGGTGLYTISPGNQIFGASSAAETITVSGTAQATGFKVRGTYNPNPVDYQTPQAPGGLWKISTL